MAHQLLHVQHQLADNLLLSFVHCVEGEILQVTLYTVNVQLSSQFLNLSFQLPDHLLVLVCEAQHPVVEVVFGFTEANCIEEILRQFSKLLRLVYDALLNIF